MKHIVTAAFAALLAAGTCAVAQNSNNQNSQGTPSQNNSANSNQNSKDLKDCMARQKATNSGLTQTQMQTTCKNEAKSGKTQKEGNDLATGTQAGDKPPQQ